MTVVAEVDTVADLSVGQAVGEEFRLLDLAWPTRSELGTPAALQALK
jgi:hypothetical protein